jgi:C-terminal processing protease CtpA/Prc
MSNKEVIQSYYEEVVNGKDFTVLDKYFHEDFLSMNLPYFGMGFGIDTTSGDKVLVNFVYAGGPSDGKLEEGDEILSVQDGDDLYQGFDAITHHPWGWGEVGTSLTLRVNRAGEEMDVEITRGVIKGRGVRLEEFKDNWEIFVKEKRQDDKVEIVHLIEEGDMVACLRMDSGIAVDFSRQYLVPNTEFFRMKDGKIVQNWGFGDNLTFYRQMGYKLEAPVKESA